MNEDIFGHVDPPIGVKAYDTAAGGIGLVLFLSRMIQILTVVAGIWALFNLILAGFVLITKKGDSGAYSEAVNKVTMSVVGLVVIVASYTIAGLVGLLLFGDATYILNPVICGPGGC